MSLVVRIDQILIEILGSLGRKSEIGINMYLQEQRSPAQLRTNSFLLSAKRNFKDGIKYKWIVGCNVGWYGLSKLVHIFSYNLLSVYNSIWELQFTFLYDPPLLKVLLYTRTELCTISKKAHCKKVTIHHPLFNSKGGTLKWQRA